MRIGVLTQYYAPEPGPATLPANLAEELSRRGHDVQVVTGFPNHPTGQLADGYRLARRRDEVREGVRVRRVYLHPDHSSAVGRMANYGSFAASTVLSGVSWLRHTDAVWVNSSPITLAWPIWALRAMRVPVVSHILDLWPESLYATGFGRMAANAPVRAALDAWTSGMYRGSNMVAYISPGVGDILTSRGVPSSKLRYVPMWADEATFRPDGTSMREELDIDDHAFVLLYAGALGEAQGLGPLIDACQRIDDPRFVCLVAGSGGAEESLRERAKDVHNVRFIGRVPQSQMTDLMATADASFVTLRDTPLGRVSIPSKTQAALAAGVPVLASAPGDVSRLVASTQSGLTADPTNVADIASAIMRLCRATPTQYAQWRANALTTYRDQFSLARGAQKVEEMLMHVARSDGRRRPTP